MLRYGGRGERGREGEGGAGEEDSALSHHGTSQGWEKLQETTDSWRMRQWPPSRIQYWRFTVRFERLLER